jgi:hypothetical protein
MSENKEGTKADRLRWRIGRRVSRKDTDELGTIVDTDGEIKVKWDGGRTSYFRRYKPANVRLEPTK